MYKVFADGDLFCECRSLSAAIEKGNLLIQFYNVFAVVIRKDGKAICARVYNQKKWRNL